MSRIYKIALCGGPRAGKSVSLSHLRKSKTSRFRFIMIPEVASFFFSTRSDEVASLDQSTILRQSYILSTELLLEWSYEQQAMRDGVCDTVILTDRGAADLFCYTTDIEYQKFFPHMAEKLKRHYDLAVFLDSNQRANWRQDETTRRIEADLDEAERLCRRTKEVWLESGYAKNTAVIPQMPTMAEKCRLTADAINRFLGENALEPFGFDENGNALPVEEEKQNPASAGNS